MDDYDVVIVGGGLSGALCALALGHINLRCLILEQQSLQSLYSVACDNRGIALAAASINVLQALGVFDNLTNYYPIKNIEVSEQGYFGNLRFNAAELDLERLGVATSAADIARAIYQQIALYDIQVEENVDNIIPEFNVLDKRWQVNYTSAGVNHQNTAKLLIAADGSNSAIRSQLGIACQTNSYPQEALVTNIHLEAMDDAKAYQRICKQGVVALLPFGINRMKLIWVSNPATLGDISVDLLSSLGSVFGSRLGKLTKHDPIKNYPLKSQEALTYVSDQAILLGDAAHTMHPIAAQGYNLTIRDIAALVDAVLDAQNTQVDFYDAIALHKYQFGRTQDYRIIKSFTETINCAMHSKQPGAGLLRALGRISCGLVPGLNKKFMRQGMGFYGVMPRLVVGICCEFAF